MNNEPEIMILVLDRGFVTVGKASISTKQAFTWHVEDARAIRRWGTTVGLAELKDGPRPETVLDTPSTEQIPFRSVIKIIEVTEKGQKNWEKNL